MAKDRARPAAPLDLRLYVAGNAPNSQRAIANVRAIVDQHFAGACQLEIIDLLEHPLRGVGDRVIVTPTLIKLRPLPERRMIGNLDDRAQVLLALGAP